MDENSNFYGHGDLTNNDQTYYWTSTESGDSAWIRGISKSTTVRRQVLDKNAGLSVRCLKD